MNLINLDLTLILHIPIFCISDDGQSSNPPGSSSENRVPLEHEADLNPLSVGYCCRELTRPSGNDPNNQKGLENVKTELKFNIQHIFFIYRYIKKWSKTWFTPNVIVG